MAVVGTAATEAVLLASDFKVSNDVPASNLLLAAKVSVPVLLIEKLPPVNVLVPVPPLMLTLLKVAVVPLLFVILTVELLELVKLTVPVPAPSVRVWPVLLVNVLGKLIIPEPPAVVIVPAFTTAPLNVVVPLPDWV